MHPQGATSKAPSNSPTRGEKEVFLNQRVSAYRFHESLNLEFNNSTLRSWCIPRSY